MGKVRYNHSCFCWKVLQYSCWFNYSIAIEHHLQQAHNYKRCFPNIKVTLEKMFTPKDICWTECQIFLWLLLVTSTELCIKCCWCWFQMSLIIRSKDNDKSRQHAPSWHKPWGLGKHMLECLWSTWQSICEQGCHWEWWKVIGEVVKPLVRQITTYFGSHLGIIGVEVNNMV